MSKRRVVRLGFRNSRRGRSRNGQIGSGPDRSTTEFTENTVRVVSVVKREFAELNALSDGSTDAIYLEDQIDSRFGRTTGHLGCHGRHIKVLGFGNPRGDEGLGGQIGSNPGEVVAPDVRGAGGGVPGNRDLREALEGEGEANCRIHLGGDAGREDDAGVGCH